MRINKKNLQLLGKTDNDSVEVYSSGSIVQISLQSTRIVHVGSSQSIKDRIMIDCEERNKQFISLKTGIDLTPPPVIADTQGTGSLPLPPSQQVKEVIIK